MTGVALMLSAAVNVSLGQLLWKLGSHGDLRFLLGGTLLYVIGAGLMTVAFRFGHLSLLHPLLSLSYVFSLILGSLVLQEAIGALKLMGVLFILAGVFVLARESKSC